MQRAKKEKRKKKIGWNLEIIFRGGESRVMYGWNFDFKLWNLKYVSVATNTYRFVGAGGKYVTGLEVRGTPDSNSWDQDL